MRIIQSSDLSINSRLLLLAGLSALAGVLLASTASFVREARNAQEAQLARLNAQADMLAFNSSATVLFHDAASASDLLQSLRHVPDVRQAALYDEFGDELATWSASDWDAVVKPERLGEKTGTTRVSEQLGIELFKPVTDSGRPVGMLYLRATDDSVKDQIVTSSRTIGLMAVLSLMFAIGVSAILQRPISRPLFHDVHVSETRQEASAPVSASKLIESTLPLDDVDFRDLVAEFIERLYDKLPQFDAAIESNDWQLLRDLSHWLRGAAGSAGFPALAQLADGVRDAALIESRRDAIRAQKEVRTISACLSVPETREAVSLAAT